MTLIISWVGADMKKEGLRLGSIYIGSDSRYSWNGSQEFFDSGSKVIGSVNFPEIFGFCGDVTFANTVLLQLLQQIDNRLLISDDDSHTEKNVKIFNYIKRAFNQYPKTSLREGFTIFHATRANKQFYCFRIAAVSKYAALTNFEIALPNLSYCIASEGSGKKDFDNTFYKWDQKRHNNYRTSRAVYHCLDETLEKTKDKRTGGRPQVVGLYRKGNSINFGILQNGKRYLKGAEVDDAANLENTEWRNELFEIIDPRTMTLKFGAQRQPK